MGPRTAIDARLGRESQAGFLATALAIVFVAGISLGCTERVRFQPGEECELNSECVEPLVCRFGRCRLQCRQRRDCPVGSICVRDADGLGGCQVEQERECELASDCALPLVCRFGECTNACDTDRDCVAGSRCLPDTDGALGCRDPSTRECRLNSDCDEPLICARDGRCRAECLADRDCRDGRVCDVTQDPTVCVFPDAGSPDASLDGAGPDGGLPPTDGGESDASTSAPAPESRLCGGFLHTCAAPPTGTLRCWGAGLEGQIGDGESVDRLTPTLVALADLDVLSCGTSHSCAVDPAGLHCWGSNADGQLGTGGGGTRATPTLVPGLPQPPTSVGAARAHTCAVSDGRLFCWGSGADGRLGLGDTDPRASPTEVDLPFVPVEVIARSRHTCVRSGEGQVACFGANGSSQLGLGAGMPTSVTVPTVVGGIDRVRQLALGALHTCALRREGTVWCWGSNGLAQLGDGTRGGIRHEPGEVAIGASVHGLAAGTEHTCARTETDVRCWGDNFSGQCGQGMDTIDVRSPTPVPGVSGVQELRSGDQHTCVRDGGNMHRCWGLNDRGQLGNGETGNPWMPVSVGWP